MREYDLDFSKDTIVVDGHICKALPDKPYVYEVQDDYPVNIGGWYFDKANKDLRIVIKTALNEFPFNYKVILCGQSC